LARDGVDRALADAEIGGDALARVSGKHQVQDLALTTVRLATHVAAVSRNLHSAAASRL
jgi:hypothetical protein